MSGVSTIGGIPLKLPRELSAGELLPGVPVGPASTVVDVGFGRGDQLVRAAELGAAVIGIDSQQAYVDFLRERMGKLYSSGFKVLCAETPPIPLEDDVADVVLCMEVLEHLVRPMLLVAELARIGKPGGLVFLTVPDPVAERVMLALAPPDYSQQPNHVQLFERDKFGSMIEGAGLELVAGGGVGFYHSLWWTLRMALATDYLPSHEAPPPPLIAAWEQLWHELERAPAGQAAIDALDQAMPKSQIVLARVPVA
jgi:SAM-dependent methyltransferase